MKSKKKYQSKSQDVNITTVLTLFFLLQCKINCTWLGFIISQTFGQNRVVHKMYHIQYLM